MAVLTILASTMVVAGWATTDRPGTYSLFTGVDVSGVPIDPDTRPVELGLRFTSSSNGKLTAVRFLRARGSASSHPVTVWSGRGQKLATATSTTESSSGWQEVALPKAVPIEAGREYLVSYHTSRYRATRQFFTNTVKSGPLSTSGVAGVYAYGDGGFPTSTWKASNYWVDVVFAPGAGGAPTPSTPAGPTATPTLAPSPTASPTLAPSPTASRTPSPTTPAGNPLALPRVPWEGGPAYYANFPAAKAAGWTSQGFFPLAVWFEGTYEQHDIDLDKAARLNAYIQLTRQSNLPLIRQNGMYAMLSEELPNYGAETTSWLLGDEVDMWAGPGIGQWTGRWPGDGTICTPAGSGCGHDVQRRLIAGLPQNDGRMRYANYGKGIMFWQSDREAAAFVNGYTSVVSADVYWYTDPNVCTSASEGPALGVRPADCRRAANYGLTMDRVRQLDAVDGRRQAVYAFVEVGHPFSEDDAPTITGDQVTGAVMNSLIHEARGIIYFNHNFGGPCESQHVLRDCGRNTTRPKVTEVNGRITALAPVLNTQSYQWRFNPALDTMLKAYGDSYYIFAMPGRPGGTGRQRLALPPGMSGARAEVLFENRTVPIAGGAIEDNFTSEFSYHIYKITP